jgi:proteic killer suppression protein
MIVSYRDKKTERFANGEHVKEFSGFARTDLIAWKWREA